MNSENHPSAAPSAPGPMMFINLWPESGMKHYSESLVHALGAVARVYYVRNYQSCLSVPGWVTNLHPIRWRGIGDLFRLAAEILRQRPAAIHLNSELPILLPLFPLLACFNSVITLHDAVPHEGERLSKRVFMRLHLLLIFLFFRKVIVHSPAIRDELPGYLQSRVHVLPHVNYRLWARGEGATQCNGPFVVLFFGRLLRYKGLEYLLEAFQRLDPNRFELVIAGEGDLSEYQIEGDNIRVINRFIPDEEMPSFFNQAHAVALPYVSASQSGVAYMAFAFGRPVIATRVGALADVVVDGENGCLIEPRSAESLHAALIRISEPTYWSRLVENVRRQNISADEEIRARLLEIYSL